MAEQVNDSHSVVTGSIFEVRFLDRDGFEVDHGAVRVFVDHAKGMTWLNGLYNNLPTGTDKVDWKFRPIQVVV